MSEKKFKTLRDINHMGYYGCNCGDYNEGCTNCLEKDIKKEAIKWIKYWKSLDQHCMRCKIWNKKRQEDMTHFFDITEKELKDE